MMMVFSRLHDRTGRLEKHTIDPTVSAILHDRTGRLESLVSVNAKSLVNFTTAQVA